MKTVSVLGLGYIGLPTAAVLASQNIRVHGVDINPDTAAAVAGGEIHIVEPGLENVVRNAVLKGDLSASTEVSPADIYLIAVPTPFVGNHVPDLSHVAAAINAIAPVLKKGDLVILESTLPVGATEQMAEVLAAKRPDLSFPQQKGDDSDVRVAYCPERVIPGSVLRELVENDRVIGGMSPKSSEAAVALYKCFVTGECVITDTRTAELSKLAENSFRDVNIAFANELSMICDKLGIDVWELIGLANRHPRVNILKPGCGVGGHCIAVDPWFIVNKAEVEARLISTARTVNDDKPRWVIDKIGAAVEHLTKTGMARENIIIACFGLAFKPDVDDLRESPALQIAETLYRMYGRNLLVVDPYIHEAPESLAGATLAHMEQALSQADIIAFLTEHKAFRVLSKDRLRAGQLVIDATGHFA